MQPDLLHRVADHGAVGVVLGKVVEIDLMILLVRSEDRLDGGNRLALVIHDRNVLAAERHVSVSLFVIIDPKCVFRVIAGGDLQLHRQREAGARHGCLKGARTLPVAVPPVLDDGQVHVAQTAVGDGPHDLTCNGLAVIGGFVGVVFASHFVAEASVRILA